MMRAGCATCHGADGHGRTTPTFTSPNITYSNLTDPQGMLQPDGTRGPTYTDATLRTAVTQGLDPEGSRLESPMPQWQLTGPEWADLLAYLKTPQVAASQRGWRPPPTGGTSVPTLRTTRRAARRPPADHRAPGAGPPRWPPRWRPPAGTPWRT